MTTGAPEPGAPRTLFVIAPWQRRSAPGGGAGSADDAHFARGFGARGWRVHVVAPRAPAWIHALGPVAFSLLATMTALRAARRLKPAVVLGQTHQTSAAVFLVGIVCGIPSVMKLYGVGTLHDPEPSRLRHLHRHAGMMAALRLPHDLWLVLDDGTRGDVALRRYGVPSDKIRVLPIGVDASLAARAGDGAALRASLVVPEGARVVLWIAQLAPWKRADHALRAFARARARVPLPLVMVIGGGGPERERLEALAHAEGIAPWVRFAGPVAHADVPDLMAAAALFVATGERSNKSVATCEAMLCGVPVVAFNAGGTGDVVRDGETGRLVPDGDVAALADAMAALLADDAGRAALGAAAREFARTRFTGWERRIEMECELIARLLAPGKS